MLSITCNGQLLLSMLIEMLTEPFSLEDVQIISANTDGVTLRLKKGLKSKIMDLCKGWEKLTGLELEYAYYSKVVQRDVNNYLSVYSDENGVVDYNSTVKIKTKGAFEIDKELHKNHSNRIIPISLLYYYIYNISPSYFIKNYLTFCNNKQLFDNINVSNIIVNNKNVIYYGVYDFFKEAKSKISDKKGESEIIYLSVNKGKVQKSKLQKINRYLVTKRGGKILKFYKTDKSLSQVVAGKFSMKIYNNLTEINSINFYDSSECEKINKEINFSYYITETMKIINAISKTSKINFDVNLTEQKQLSLF